MQKSHHAGWSAQSATRFRSDGLVVLPSFRFIARSRVETFGGKGRTRLEPDSDSVLTHYVILRERQDCLNASIVGTAASKDKFHARLRALFRARGDLKNRVCYRPPILRLAFPEPIVCCFGRFACGDSINVEHRGEPC